MSNSIEVEVSVRQPSPEVWNLFNDPDHITRWNFASDDWCCPRSENDLRVGGRLCSRMEAVDGRFGFDFEAIYDEVEPESKLAYTMADGRKAGTCFESLGEETRVATSFEAETENPIELQRAGWQAILENFKKYVESL